jgi:type IV pilus assembly protein PilW
VSLVELMVGLTVGLLLLTAISYFFVGSRQVGRTHNDVSRMQESGRVGLNILGTPIRQAGARASPLLAFSGTPLTGTEGGSGFPDGITVRYEVQDGGEADCLGNAVPSGVIVTYVFALNTNTHTLTCSNGGGGDPVVVMDNIDDLQITYGVDTNADGIIDSYQTASGLVPSQVAAVRVNLLVRGQNTHIAATDTQTMSFNGSNVTFTDGIMRQVYTSTFTVRNQAK